MRGEKLTVKEALKYARHDFLNELQIILLNLDLERQSEARQAILNATNRMQQCALLERLGLPKTELWLSSFGWVYTSFNHTLHCEIEVGPLSVDDQQLATLLEKIFSAIEKTLDPIKDYDVHINVSSSQSEWELQFVFMGGLSDPPEILEVDENFSVQKMQFADKWIITIQGQ